MDKKAFENKLQHAFQKNDDKKIIEMVDDIIGMDGYPLSKELLHEKLVDYYVKRLTDTGLGALETFLIIPAYVTTSFSFAELNKIISADPRKALFKAVMEAKRKILETREKVANAFLYISIAETSHSTLRNLLQYLSEIIYAWHPTDESIRREYIAEILGTVPEHLSSNNPDLRDVAEPEELKEGDRISLRVICAFREFFRIVGRGFVTYWVFMEEIPTEERAEKNNGVSLGVSLDHSFPYSDFYFNYDVTRVLHHFSVDETKFFELLDAEGEFRKICNI